MKITQSRDGEKRLELTIKLRVTASEMVDAIAWKILSQRLDFPENVAMAVESELKAFKSRRSILIALKEAFRSEGQNIWVWTDSVDLNLCNTIKEQATILVFKKFPQFKTLPVA